MKPKNGQSWYFFLKTSIFGAYIKKNQHIHFLMHGYSSWSTFSLHLVRGPRLWKLIFQEVLDYGSWTMNLYYWQRPPSMVRLYGSLCKPLLKLSSVKLRRIRINPIFNQPKHPSSRFVGFILIPTKYNRGNTSARDHEQWSCRPCI